MTGIYSSAIVISRDSELRRNVRKSTIEQFKLLDNIGSAYMEQELEKRVLSVVKNYSEHLAEQGGFEPSISNLDAQQYIKQAIDEVKKQKKIS
jgi:hypothetical protein